MLRAMRRNALVWLLVIAVAALIAHACGYAFGVANQATYFLQALHRADPELLRHDWLVTSTTEYHSVFSIVGSLMFRIDETGATAFGIAHFILMVTLVCGVFLVVRGSTERAVLPIFVLVAGWLAVNGVRSVAGSYVWSCYLQPSLIGSVGWVIGLALHVRGRPLATGIALAVGGLFHANFLLLGIGAFGLAELVADGDGRARRVALLLAPQLVALAVLAPELFGHASGHDPDRALELLIQFHAPTHYKPVRIVRTLPSLLRWIALAIVVAPVALELGQRAAVRRLVWWTAITAGICAIGTVVMMIPAIMPLTRLFVWRLAPFAVAAAQLVIAIAVAATIADPKCWQAQPIWRRVAAAVLLVWIATHAPFMPPGEANWVLWVTLAAIAIAWVTPARWRSIALTAAAAVTLAAPLWYRRVELLHPSVGVYYEGLNDEGLYTWARTSTPVDAVFLTPPDLYRFRLIARRAVYADFKSPPLAPDALIEWHARLCRMNGALPTDKKDAHRQHWLDATGDELLARSRELGVDYLVVDRTPTHDQIAARPVYSNDVFAVFAVHD
jgi:hypothetical protein